MIIKRLIAGTPTDILTIHPADNSEYIAAVMGDEYLSISFKSRTAHIFLRNDYVEYSGKNYKLKIPRQAKIGLQGWYEYNLRFEGSYYELKEATFFNFDNNSTVPFSAEFNITCEPLTVLTLLVNNMSRSQSGWTVGSAITANAQTITFSNTDCLSALKQIADAYGSEYVINNKEISIKKHELSAEPLVLGRGYNQGLVDFTASDSTGAEKLLTRIYPYGSERNIENYRASKRLLMPIADGAYLSKNEALYGVIERVVNFDDIYPRLVYQGEGTPGAVTHVTIDEANRIYKFKDSNLDFDLNAQLLSGITAKVVFITGELAGLEFEVSNYDTATKEVTLIVANDLPKEALIPAIGDEYCFSDIKMPATYITNAENELKAAAQDYLDTYSEYVTEFTAQPDTLYFKRNTLALSLGQIINLKDAGTGIDVLVRVASFNQNINQTYKYSSIKLNTETTKTTLSSLAAKINNKTTLNQDINRTVEPGLRRATVVGDDALLLAQTNAQNLHNIMPLIYAGL